MLRDRYRQLLTAYVDGELSSRQRRHVVRLLHRSAEARQFLQQLKADSRALRELPNPPPPADLTGTVLRIISERNLTPGRKRVVSTSSTAPWMGPLLSWATAAAVLLILGVASYFYFAASLENPSNTEMAQKQQEPSPSRSQAEELGAPIEKDGGTEQPRLVQPAPKMERPSVVESPKVAQNRDKKTKSSPGHNAPLSAKEDTALTDRVETFQFDRVPDLLPVIVKLSDLDRPPARKNLIAQLSKDSAFRLELPCPNGTKAFERVQNAARKQRISLVIDKPAQERIKLRWRISYVLYMENVTPEELTQFLQQIDAEDHKKVGGKPSEAQFDRLVLTYMTAGHRKELTTLLGVDPTSAGPMGNDSRNPLADATARQVEQALAGQGGVPRPGGGQQATQALENSALVLAYNPVRPSPGSEEIKHFLESRKPALPGTLRILLVLRNG
jgi:hypothetical protein